MVFVDRASLKDLFSLIDLKQVQDFEEELFYRTIPFFNTLERRNLLLYKLLMSDPWSFIQREILPLDQVRLGFQIQGHRYHADQDCDYYSPRGQREKHWSSVEQQINYLLDESDRFFHEHPVLQSSINNIHIYSGKVFSSVSDDENAILSWRDRQASLEYYFESFKEPVKGLLFEYYQLFWNPGLKFDPFPLQKVGFLRCEHCCRLEDVDFFEVEDHSEIVYDPLDDHYCYDLSTVFHSNK